jgi:hypothetical protein
MKHVTSADLYKPLVTDVKRLKQEIIPTEISQNSDSINMTCGNKEGEK